MPHKIDKTLCCFTIGHSNHNIEYFVNLLASQHINCIIDVRSVPYSNHTPQFNSNNLKMKLKEHNAEISAQRKTMVGSGDRSDKIRTYNFPQNRVTDHRIGLTLYNLSNIMEGDLDELLEQLKIADMAEKLQASN